VFAATTDVHLAACVGEHDLAAAVLARDKSQRSKKLRSASMGKKSSGAVLDSSRFVVVLVPLQPYRSPQRGEHASPSGILVNADPRLQAGLQLRPSA
jgi:hypothetical protein